MARQLFVGLREFHKSRALNKIEEACNIGDVVLIHEDNAPN